MRYQEPMSNLELAYMAMAMDEEREVEAPEWVEGIAKNDTERRKRLARECAKVDPRVEIALAEEGMRHCPGCRKRRPSGNRRTKKEMGI